jgi:DNA-directed RNA polymerase subunit beta
MPSRTTERINFGKIKEIIAPPNLIELQTNSYREFLQADQPPSKRKNLGLQAVFTEVFPIESYDGKCVLDFHSYEIGEPKLDWLECLREGLTYGAPLYVTFLLKEEKGTKEEKVFMGELPLMTPQGTFVINGAERVIVSQLHRSPGLAFEATQHPNGKTLHSFRIIPDRGSWYEAQFDTSDMLYVYLDRKKRRRKFLTTTLFRALSFLDHEGKGKEKDSEKNHGTDEEILKLFYEIEDMSVKEAEKRDDLANKVLIQDAVDPEKNLVVARAFEPLSKAVVKQIAELGVHKIKVVDTTADEGIVIKCMKKDPAKNEEEALKDIYRRLRPGDPPTAANARALIKRLFFDPKRYDLGRVGRYKINQKLGIKGGDSRILTKADLVAATKYLLRLKRGEGSLDDIDHLGSRRVRTVGELLANQCRVGLARTERLVKERMTLFDQGVESMSPQKLINPKALSAVIRDFFGRSQLSQFMDQINPLAELTHKRRLSALGPGGLSRDRAGFEVRDVHPSH